MKRLIIIGFLFLSIILQNGIWAQNYDFTAVAPSGQTFYYSLQNNDTEVKLVPPRDNNNLILSNYHPSGNVIIPDSVEWMGVSLPVVSIGSWALSSSSITSILLSSTLKKIEQYAFRGTSITEIEIPSNIIRIEWYVFENCASLRRVRILCTNASSGISGSHYNLSSPYNNIFNSCSNIEEVYFEQYIAFPKSNLKKLTFGNSIDTIPTTFKDCDHLKNVVIGNSIHTIPNECFEDCDSLRVVTLGSGVLAIGDRAFRKCINLDTIYAKPDTAPSLGLNAFSFTPSSKAVVTYCNANYSSAWGTTGFNYVTAGVYSISLGVNCTSCGNATTVQDVDCNNTAIIMATPANNYSFNSWSDGNTENPRTITLTHDTILNALFSRIAYDVNANSNNITMGSVVGGGTYAVGDTAELIANAICGYRFNHWSNGSTTNPLSFIPTSDTAFTAFFEIALDTIFVPDTTLEVVVLYDTTIYPVTIYDTTINDVTLYDTTIIPLTLYDTTIVNVYIFDTMNFTIPVFDTIHFQVIDTTYEPIHDTVIIHDTIYIHDTIITGIGDVSVFNAKIYANNGELVVEGGLGEDVMLYDLTGRLVAIRRKCSSNIERFQFSTSGTYLVKIGNHPAKKVVVIK